MNASSGDAHGSASVWDYLHVVRRQKWVIIQAVVLVPVLALLYSWHQPSIYQGSSQVLLSGQNLANVLDGIQSSGSSTPDQTTVDTQARLARVPEIARRSIAKLGVRMSPDEFLADSSVTAGSNTVILTFTFSNTNRSLAARAANVYAAEYVAYRRLLDTASLESARLEVENRINQLIATGANKGSIYATLVERDQQLRTMEALQTSNASVVQTTDHATHVSPRPTRNAILGLFLGILLGLALAFMRETLDTRIRTAQEVADRLLIPLLGRVPEPPKRLRVADRLTMLEEPSGVQSEAFRVLRTNLEFSALEHDIRTVMITSAVQQEGKSTTIANLAIALARGGQRTILVDLDLRRPYLDKFFDLEGRPGVTQVGLGRASIEEAMTPIEITPARPSATLESRYDLSGSTNGGRGVLGELFVIGAGPIPPDPGEFVGSRALGDVLTRLRDMADIVLVDAPPMLRVGDAMVLSGKVDALLIATRMEKLRRPMLGELRRLLERVPARLLGFVVTGAESEYGYGYGYEYGYQYGDDSDTVSADRSLRLK